jgi:hypothetical protein
MLNLRQATREGTELCMSPNATGATCNVTTGASRDFVSIVIGNIGEEFEVEESV